MTTRLPVYLLLVPILAGMGLPSPSFAEASQSPASPQALSVWTQSTAYRVQPTTAPSAQAAITMEGACALYEAYQVIVRASGAALTGVNMSAGALQDGAGDTIPAADLAFFREDFIDFTKDTSAAGTWPVPKYSPTKDGHIPDPLVPLIDPYTGNPAGAPFSVPANTNQPAWLDVHIPAAAAAGVYTGTVQVTASAQAPVSVPLTLTVWNITLPDMRADTTWFGLSSDNVINYHSGTYQCSTTDPTDCWLSYDAYARTIVQRYEELAHEHRVDTGQAFVPDPSTYLPSGCPEPPADWSSFDAAVAPYMNGTYWSDGVASTWLRTPFSPGAGWGADAVCTQAQYTALAAAWAAHLRSRGWFNRALVFAADEPDPSEYAAIVRNSVWLQDADPGWKAQIIDTVAPTPGNVSVLDPALGTYVVALAWYDDWAGKTTYGRARVAVALRPGHQAVVLREQRPGCALHVVRHQHPAGAGAPHDALGHVVRVGQRLSVLEHERLERGQPLGTQRGLRQDRRRRPDVPGQPRRRNEARGVAVRCGHRRAHPFIPAEDDPRVACRTGPCFSSQSSAGWAPTPARRSPEPTASSAAAPSAADLLPSTALSIGAPTTP